MHSIQPRMANLFQTTFRFSRVHLLALVLLAAFTVVGCGSGEDAAEDSTSSTTPCIFEPETAANATFGRSLATNMLELQIDSTDSNQYTIDFCVQKPHSAGITGISADVNLVSTDSNEADVNVMLVPYQTTNERFLFTELFFAQDGEIRWGVEICDDRDICTILQNSIAQLTGQPLNTVYNLSIQWNGSDTLTYTVIGGTGGTWTYTIPGAYTIVDDQSTTSDVAIGLFTSSTGGIVSTIGQFDNVMLSTDSTTFLSYDTFTGSDGSFDGGSNWDYIEGLD